MRIPEIQERLRWLSDKHSDPEIAMLADELNRRKPLKRAPSQSQPMTDDVRQQILSLHLSDRMLAQCRLAAMVGVNPGRVSETSPWLQVMRINDSRCHRERGPDAYFTPSVATEALIRIEDLPSIITDPACGDGAILRVLHRHGYDVRGSDIIDYGWHGTIIEDYLTSKPVMRQGIVTNPPFLLALPFLEKAISESPYVAFLLRLNFLESSKRMPFFLANPPSRVWISSRRLPMMHRNNYDGKKISGSNQTFAWMVWGGPEKTSSQLNWFDWRHVA